MDNDSGSVIGQQYKNCGQFNTRKSENNESGISTKNADSGRERLKFPLKDSIEKDVTKEYGTTYNWRETGYILTDGEKGSYSINSIIEIALNNETELSIEREIAKMGKMKKMNQDKKAKREFLEEGTPCIIIEKQGQIFPFLLTIEQANRCAPLPQKIKQDKSTK